MTTRPAPSKAATDGSGVATTVMLSTAKSVAAEEITNLLNEPPTREISPSGNVYPVRKFPVKELEPTSVEFSYAVRVSGEGVMKSDVAKSSVTPERLLLKLIASERLSRPAGPGSPKTLPVKVSNMLW